MFRWLAFVALLWIPVTAVAETPRPGDIAAMSSADQTVTRFTLITPTGFVSFTADSSWPLLQLQGQLPIATVAFAVPDPADVNTQESTNLAINLYQIDSMTAHKAVAEIGQRYGDAPVKSETYKDWTLYTQLTRQGSTAYTLIDAMDRKTDVVVGVRLVWPHLPGQPRDHEAQMRATMLSLLDSMQSGTGAYQTEPGEVVRHPKN